MPETPTFFVRGATGDNLVVTPIFPYDPEPIAEAGEASVAPSKTSPGSSIKNMPSETYESTGEESPNLGANHKLIIDTNSKVSSGHNSGDEQEGDKVKKNVFYYSTSKNNKIKLKNRAHGLASDP